MIVRAITVKTGHAREISALEKGEKTFDETFPTKIDSM